MEPAIVIAVASSLVTTAYHHLAEYFRRERERVEACSHAWGDVLSMRAGRGAPFHYRRCSKCRSQLHCNADGSPYVPRNRRPKE